MAAATPAVRFVPGASDGEEDDVFPADTTDEGGAASSGSGTADRPAVQNSGGDEAAAAQSPPQQAEVTILPPAKKQNQKSWFRRAPRSKSADAVSDSDSEPWNGRDPSVSWAGKRQPKGGIQRSMERYRERNMQKFQESIQDWLPRELEAFRAPTTSEDAVCRVLVIRHGMGKHNDLKGAFSYANRDAELNEVGEEQSAILGNALRTNGILDEFDLAVVSPFRRTVQTANGVFGAEGKRIRTYIQPLCAEHTFNWSVVQQGDRGSTPEELLEQFPDADFPQYRKFEDINTYCHEAEVRKDGAWWHHGQRTSESHVEFRERAIAFKKWLGQYCVKEGLKTAVVVSHGGFLSTAFGLPKLHNCEMRAFDLTSDGRYQRVAADAIQESDAAKRLEIYTIHTSKKEGHKQYQLCGVLDQQPFTRLWRLSDIRTTLYEVIKSSLTDGSLAVRIGADVYSQHVALQTVINGFPKSSIGAVAKLKEWLWNLDIALRQQWCPSEVSERVRYFFTGAAMHRGSELPGAGVIKWSDPTETPQPRSPADSDDNQHEMLLQQTVCSDDDDGDSDGSSPQRPATVAV